MVENCGHKAMAVKLGRTKKNGMAISAVVEPFLKVVDRYSSK